MPKPGFLNDLQAIDGTIQKLMQERQSLARVHQDIFTDEVRKWLVSQYEEDLLGGSFGDGMEEEYVVGGTLIIGSSELSDIELFDWVAQNADMVEDERGEVFEDEPMNEALAQIRVKYPEYDPIKEGI